MNSSRHNGATKVNEFRFILHVRDIQKQRSFYEKVFDWPVIESWSSGVTYDTGAATVELIHKAEAEIPNGFCRIALSVPDVWSLYDRLKEDVNVVVPLRDNSWGDTSFRIQDPEGFVLTLFSPSK